MPFCKKIDITETKLPQKGGIVVGYQKINGKEKVYFIDDDMHSLVLGATRSGKTRSILLQSICFTALSGESLLISDPKGEIFDFTCPFLKNAGMKVIALDFKNPLKSSHYNFLQPVINAVKIGDIPKAVSLTWDLTASLVPETKGEPIWQHGESSIIAGSIMSVVFDNMANTKFQNLTNVYYFINYMCKAGEKGELPLNKYIESLQDNHPAKALFGISIIAPSKTRGSFFTSALATLRLFTDPNINSMTCKSDFELTELGEKRQALFIILPDAKKTYYGLASLFVEQLYIALADHADNLGGRLKKRVNFILEEFGNFTKINLTSMLTVGAGRGIRFNIVVQSFSQIEEKYGKEQTETVKDNCHCLIYLRSENPNTNLEISKRLGKYTTSSYGRSNSMKKGSNENASMNLIARDLLMPEEINKILRPYLLVMLSGQFPAIMQLPDISQWHFNTMLGMGDKAHNTNLRLMQQNLRKENPCEPLNLWGIWHNYKVGTEIDKTAENENNTGIPDLNVCGNADDFPEQYKNETDYSNDEEDEQDTYADQYAKEAIESVMNGERWEQMNAYEKRST